MKERFFTPQNKSIKEKRKQTETLTLKTEIMKKIISLICLIASAQLAMASSYYWVGGTGNWNDFVNHWATTSGGAVHRTQAPTLNDDVFFDANSFPTANDTVKNISAALCQKMNWTGASNNPVFGNGTGSIQIGGSLTLIPSMKWNYDGAISFNSNLGTFNNLIFSAGKKLTTDRRAHV